VKHTGTFACTFDRHAKTFATDICNRLLLTEDIIKIKQRNRWAKGRAIHWAMAWAMD
jgi:hypothetical protein